MIESLKQKLAESQAREMRLLETVKDHQYLQSVGMGLICSACATEKGNIHLPDCGIEKVLNQPAPPLAEVLEKVESALKIYAECTDQTDEKDAREALAALQSLRGGK